MTPGGSRARARWREWCRICRRPGGDVNIKGIKHGNGTSRGLGRHRINYLFWEISEHRRALVQYCLEQSLLVGNCVQMVS